MGTQRVCVCLFMCLHAHFNILHTWLSTLDWHSSDELIHEKRRDYNQKAGRVLLQREGFISWSHLWRCRCGSNVNRYCGRAGYIFLLVYVKKDRGQHKFLRAQVSKGKYKLIHWFTTSLFFSTAGTYQTSLSHLEMHIWFKALSCTILFK